MKRWWIPMIAALAAIAVSVWFYPQLPEQMAIHFGSDDNPDQFASKAIGAFLLPVIIVFVTAVTNLSVRFERNESKRQRLLSSNDTVTAIVACVLLGVHLFTIAHNLGYKISPMLFAAITVGITFIAVGNIMPRMPQSTLRTFSLPDAAYARYARFNGRIMVAVGFLMVLTTLLPPAFIMPTFGALVVLLLGTLFVSASYFKRNATP